MSRAPTMNASRLDPRLAASPAAELRETTREPVSFLGAEGAPALEVLLGPQPGRCFALDRRVTVIGRARGVDLRIDARGLSRLHAKIVMLSDGATDLVNLVDLGSTNGSFVNRGRVDVALVREGDQIQLGAHVVLALTRRRIEASAADQLPQLTSRQLEVARLVSVGATNLEVARALGLSARTVASHLERIYRQLGIGSRAELTRWMIEHDEGELPRA